jgi:hypothetical protein
MELPHGTATRNQWLWCIRYFCYRTPVAVVHLVVLYINAIELFTCCVHDVL